MDLLHSKVSLAFVSGSWIPQDPLQPSALTPPCATPWVLLFFAPFSCWALPCWHDSHLLCHCGFARPSRACCPNLSPLIGPGLSSLLRSCRSGPLLMRTLVLPASLSPLALAYVSLHEAAQPCCSLASVCCFFVFVEVYLFIIIIQQIASQLKLKGQFMEIGFLLFPIQQFREKLIRHLLNKVLLSGVLICI